MKIRVVVEWFSLFGGGGVRFIFEEEVLRGVRVS